MVAKKMAKLKLGGKERTFYFGLGFLGLFIENTESTLETLQQDIKDNPFKVLPELMYYSLAYGYKRKDLETDFNKYDVSDWIDDAGGVDSEIVTAFMDGLGSSMNSGLPEEKPKGPRGKVGKPKKVTS